LTVAGRTEVGMTLRGYRLRNIIVMAVAPTTVTAIVREANQAEVQMRTNISVWRQGDFVKHYASRVLRPAEVMVLIHYRELFSGRVLELGCGAGRLTGYLIELGQHVYGIDVSPTMIAYCREAYPAGDFSVMDLRDLSGFEKESLDVVVATNNVLDVLDDSERRRVLREITRVLKPEGLLTMSAHNRAFLPNLKLPTNLRARNLVRMAGKLVLMPSRMRNRRHLLRFQRFERDYAVVNDDAHHFKLLHYYISREDQERQLREEGFEFLECRNSEGGEVAVGDSAANCAELHYVARRPPAHPA
jgi:SAM-dependent methyltransferase